jgi:hypothetical protein
LFGEFVLCFTGEQLTRKTREAESSADIFAQEVDDFLEFTGADGHIKSLDSTRPTPSSPFYDIYKIIQ